MLEFIRLERLFRAVLEGSDKPLLCQEKSPTLVRSGFVAGVSGLFWKEGGDVAQEALRQES